MRTARAAVFAAVCVGISAAGHGWMSGMTITPTGLAIGATAVLAVAYLAAGRERHWPGITATLLAGEIGLHELFCPTSMAEATMPNPGITAMPGMAGMPDMATHGSGTWLDGLVHGTAGMVAAHAAAGLVCGWWLRIGERAAFELLRLLTSTVIARIRRLLATDATAPLPARRRGLMSVVDVRPPDAGIILRDCVVRRGPPMVTAV
jgi:hypothetical protein